MDVEKKFAYERFTAAEGELNYRLYVPEKLDKPVPLVLFLHGLGERGTDNEGQLKLCILKGFANPESPLLGAVVIAPQCPPEPSRWVVADYSRGNYRMEEVAESQPLKLVYRLVKEFAKKDFVDSSRIYVMGLSMGGFATWDLLARHGELFAAGVPICGGGDPHTAKRLAEIPIFAFHGTLDALVPPASTRNMVAAIRAERKGKIQYVEFPEVAHGAWNPAILFRGDEDNPPLLEWLFAQQKI